MEENKPLQFHQQKMMGHFEISVFWAVRAVAFCDLLLLM